MLKIYGSMLCPDCVRCKEDLDRAGIPYIYYDFSDNLIYLKQFLSIRDRDPIFQDVRENGKIGIPCILTDDGSVLLNWDTVL